MGRRQFLAVTGTAAAGLALPSFLPRALSAPANERLATGHVGVGGRGGSLLGQALANRGISVAVVCDVDANRLVEARKRVEKAGQRADACTDFRRLLDRGDIDAVVVATADHWHAGVTIDACRAGKDVYVEKPLCHNIAEGRAMVRAAREHRRMVQVGINHRSAPYTREIARIIRGGRIGKVHLVKNWMWENKSAPRTPPRSPPVELDWDFWLGPAPKVPYHPQRAHFNFRWCRDYAGGYMTDWGVHMLNVVTFAMDADLTGPVLVEASGEFQEDNLYDFPMKMEARWEFEEPKFTLTWTQPSGGGDVLPGEKYGMTFYGEDGQLRTGFGDGMVKFYRDGREAPLPREGRAADVPHSPGHLENWLESIKSRKPPIADVEIGHRTTSICLLANAVLFSGERKLRWDWRKEEFPGDAQANRWLSRAPRDAYRA